MEIWAKMGPFWAPRGTQKGPNTRQKGPILVIKGPFGDLGGPWRAPVDQIWYQLPPIGLPGLDSWSPLTLTCIVLMRAPACYRVVHLVILLYYSFIHNINLCMYHS